MGGALDERGVWMARTHVTVACWRGFARRATIAILTCAMVTGQVPTAAFAEALGGEEAAQQGDGRVLAWICAPGDDRDLDMRDGDRPGAHRGVRRGAGR